MIKPPNPKTCLICYEIRNIYVFFQRPSIFGPAYLDYYTIYHTLFISNLQMYKKPTSNPKPEFVIMDALISSTSTDACIA